MRGGARQYAQSLLRPSALHEDPPQRIAHGGRIRRQVARTSGERERPIVLLLEVEPREIVEPGSVLRVFVDQYFVLSNGLLSIAQSGVGICENAAHTQVARILLQPFLEVFSRVRKIACKPSLIGIDRDQRG